MLPRRLIIKIGTQVIAGEKGPNLGRIGQMTEEASELVRSGHEVVLVSSGAVAAGWAKPTALSGANQKKIWAAVGQPMLMESYAKAFARFGLRTAQVLVLRNEFTNRESFDNLSGAIKPMLAEKIIPVLNENDPLKTEDLTLGDNDILSAMAEVALSADKLLILTAEDGLYNADQNRNQGAKLIKEITDVDFEIERLCSKEKTAFGSGGILSKVRAARHAVATGIEVLIGSGTKAGIIPSATEKNFPGTRFPAKNRKPATKAKRWMLSAKGIGLLMVDDGAARALRAGKSLLLPGIFSLKGNFEKKEIVEIVSKSGQAIAYGRVNYESSEIQSAMARKTMMNNRKILRQLEKAKRASVPFGLLSHGQRVLILKNLAKGLRRETEEILKANKRDLRRLLESDPLRDRLLLNKRRVSEMARQVLYLAKMPDSIGRTFDHRRRQGLEISKKQVPIGVVAVIYESRPNVTVDTAAAGIKSSNAMV